MCRESVHIEVEDVDDSDLDWRQRSYYAEVVEGKVYDRLVHLEATELEGYDAASEVCRYRILTPDMPFQVDADGRVIFSVTSKLIAQFEKCDGCIFFTFYTIIYLFCNAFLRMLYCDDPCLVTSEPIVICFI